MRSAPRCAAACREGRPAAGPNGRCSPNASGKSRERKARGGLGPRASDAGRLARRLHPSARTPAWLGLGARNCCRCKAGSAPLCSQTRGCQQRQPEGHSVCNPAPASALGAAALRPGRSRPVARPRGRRVSAHVTASAISAPGGACRGWRRRTACLPAPAPRRLRPRRARGPTPGHQGSAPQGSPTPRPRVAAQVRTAVQRRRHPSCLEAALPQGPQRQRGPPLPRLSSG
mmetsp:Transcript_66114/g.183062  ORF Transcript_66114/g.183062 Transcript_66114/m.183062 type:complete len:230 (-) Transcript_66114:1157-1846(-)